MRKSFSVLVLVICGLWGASQARAASICDAVTGNLVANCGFETGDFTDWTIGGNTANPGDNYYGVDAFDANSGNYGAYMSEDVLDGGTAPVDLSETLVTTVGGEYDITYYLENDTPPQTGYAQVFSSTFGGTTMQTLTNPAAAGSFVEYSYEETTASASTTLEFAFENDDSYWSFDDVSVVATPEPSTWLLLLAGCGFCGLVARRSPAFLGRKQ